MDETAAFLCLRCASGLETHMEEISPENRRFYRRLSLVEMKNCNIVDDDELRLFEWYNWEFTDTLKRMSSEVEAFISEQSATGLDDNEVNDSGKIAIDYFLSRAREADVVYLTSLLEHYLSRASEKLESIIGERDVAFRPNELKGNKWERHRKFLERHGVSEFPQNAWSTLSHLISCRNAIVHERKDALIKEEYIAQSLLAFRSLVEHVNSQINQSIDRTLQPQG